MRDNYRIGPISLLQNCSVGALGHEADVRARELTSADIFQSLIHERGGFRVHLFLRDAELKFIRVHSIRLNYTSFVKCKNEEKFLLHHCTLVIEMSADDIPNRRTVKSRARSTYATFQLCNLHQKGQT